MMRRIRFVVSLCALVVVSDGCMLYRCGTKARSLDAEGTLGDSVTAVVSQNAQVPGRVFVALNQWSGSIEQHQVNVFLNYWSFADSVKRVELVRASDPARVPLFTALANRGYAVRDTFFNMDQMLTSESIVNDLRAVILGGDGMLILHGHSGIPVGAKLRSVNSSEYADACT